MSAARRCRGCGYPVSTPHAKSCGEPRTVKAMANSFAYEKGTIIIGRQSWAWQVAEARKAEGKS